MVDLVPVQSSNIEAVGYDPEQKTMSVRFKGGNIYHYHDVEKDTHEALVGAKSVGSHFHANIKNKYKFSK
jgi:hypothetical protein